MAKLIGDEGLALEEADVNREFAQAMAAPEPDEPEAPAPKRADAKASPAAEAPRSRSKDDKARTASAVPSTRRTGTGRRASKKPATEAAPVKGKYAKPVAELLDALVLAAAIVPMPETTTTVRVRAQARLIQAHESGLAAAIDAAACHNAMIRRGVEALTMGSAGWVLPAAMAVAPFAMASVQLWRSPVSPDMVEGTAAWATTVRADLQKQMEECQAALAEEQAYHDQMQAQGL